MIGLEVVYKALKECAKGIESIIEQAVKALKEISNGVIEVQEKFDMTEKVRSTWMTPKKIVMHSQVMMRKPMYVIARSNL